MLSAKQELAIKRAPQGKKEALRAAFLEQNKKTQRPVKGRGKGTGQYRAPPRQQRRTERAYKADGWARPAVQVSGQALGSVKSRPKSLISYFDARSPHHLPNNRACGAYSVCRVTMVVKSGSEMNIVGLMRQRLAANSPFGEWNNVCMVSDVVAATAVGANLNTTFYGLPMADFARAQISPCALTVRVTAIKALTEASGNVYIARPTAQMALAGETSSWRTIGQRVISHMSPEVIPAARLVLGASVSHSYPLDPESCAEFTDMDYAATYDTSTGVNVTWDYATGTPSGAQRDFSGFAPVIVYNQSNAELEFTITVQYRTRFYVTHPASSGHTDYRASPAPLVERAMDAVKQVGHAISDDYGWLERQEGRGNVADQMLSAAMRGVRYEL